MYHAESGALWVIYISFIDWPYRFWILAGFIDHFFGKLESIFCFTSDLRFILLQNIVDIIGLFLLLGATYTVTKSIVTSNVQILQFFLQIQQCNE